MLRLAWRRQTLAGVFGAVLVVGCGGESASDDTETSSIASTVTVTATADGSSTTGGSGGAAGGTQTTAGATIGGTSATASTSGGPGADCSGAFGEPVVLFTAETHVPQSFAITPDELELYYVNDPNEVRIIERRVRSSRSTGFGPAEAVPELLDLCPSLSSELAVGTIDLSPDGLVAYIACEEDLSLPTVLVTARRQALGAPFAPDAAPLGTVGASFATADGLEGFSNTPGVLDQLDRHQRASLSEPFGTAERLQIQLRAPDPSNDGLWLFGTVPIAGSATGDYHLAATSRPDRSAPLAEPSTQGFPSAPEGFSDYTPTISADCRSLYFLRFGQDGVFEVMVAER